MTLTKASYI